MTKPIADSGVLCRLQPMKSPSLGAHVMRALVLLSVLPLAARAQTGVAGQVELGGYGSYTHYDAATALAGQSGAGGRLGFYLSRLLSLEANGDYAVTQLPAGADVSVSRIGGNLLFHARAMGLYLGAGYERLYQRGARVGEPSGGRLVLGSLMSLGGRAAFRIEGVASYLPKGDTALADRAMNFGANVGLSVFAFGGAPRDADHDHVANKKDRCPDTPLGAVVDANGCPVDTDGDKVFDGLDACPGTPAGATVDEKGCPLDSDHDGVFDGIDLCANTPLAPRWMPTGAPWIATRTASLTDWTTAPIRPSAPESIPTVARSTATRTACSTAWTSAPTPLPALRWTPRVAR